MSNNPRTEKKLAVLGALIEGCSIRSTERMFNVHRDTITRLLARVGEGCSNLLAEKMVDLPCTRLEIDELWSYVGKKQRHVKKGEDESRVGDQWCFVAIDAETKVIPTFAIGKRTEETTNLFIADVAGRLRNKVQISTDGLRMYIAAISQAFGAVDYAQIVKQYEAEPVGPGRYSPPKVSATEKTPIFGEPVTELVSTSFVERQNLTMRMGMRRFTRLTNAFSKKIENHAAAVALHVASYNYTRIHRTLRTTPAMALGIESTVWDLGDLLAAAEERAA